jgi:hypothetical protein
VLSYALATNDVVYDCSTIHVMDIVEIDVKYEFRTAFEMPLLALPSILNFI